jgi:hypothetical protein
MKKQAIGIHTYSEIAEVLDVIEVLDLLLCKSLRMSTLRLASWSEVKM